VTRRTKRLGCFAFATLLSSCSLLEPVPDPSRFYVLTTATDVPSDPPLSNVSLGLGPVRLPDYLRRQEIVCRTGPTEIRPSPIDRWAGGLEGGVVRVLAENLARFVGTDRIAVYPSLEIVRADYMIEINVVRFDLDAQNTATLQARWQVRDTKSKAKEPSVSRETQSTHAATSSDMAAGVEALSLTLADLSRDIAAVVRELNARR